MRSARDEFDDGSSIGLQCSRGRLDFGIADGSEASGQFGDQAGSSEDQLELGEVEGSRDHGVHVAHEDAGEAGAHPVEFTGIDAVRGDAVEFLVDGAHDSLERAGVGVVRGDRQRRGVALVERVAELAEVGRHVGDEVIALNQAALQPGRVAVGKEFGEQHVGQVSVEVTHGIGHAITHRQRGNRRMRVLRGCAPFGCQQRLAEVGTFRGRTLLDRPEMLLDQGNRLLDVDVAGHRENRIGRRVVAVEEVRGVVDGSALQVDEIAVTVVRIGERVEQDRRKFEPGEAPVRSVEHVDADFLLHDGDLVGEVLLVDARGKHPVGLEEQPALESVRGHRLEVVRVVRVGASVERPAGGLHVPEVGEFLQVRRALEHQMLEEMGESGAPFGLGAKAHVVEHRDADDGRRAVRREHDTQPVGQRHVRQVERRTGQLLRMRCEGCDTRHPTTLRPGVETVQTTLIALIKVGTRGHKAFCTLGTETYHAETLFGPLWTATIHNRS